MVFRSFIDQLEHQRVQTHLMGRTNLELLREMRDELLKDGVPIEEWNKSLSAAQLELAEALHELGQTCKAIARESWLGRLALRLSR